MIATYHQGFSRWLTLPSVGFVVAQGTTQQGVVIEDDCWLGTGVKVLDGVTIGQGSVIGAGAVVGKNILPDLVAVGVPAQVIANRNKEYAPRNTIALTGQ